MRGYGSEPVGTFLHDNFCDSGIENTRKNKCYVQNSSNIEILTGNNTRKGNKGNFSLTAQVAGLQPKVLLLT